MHVRLDALFLPEHASECADGAVAAGQCDRR